MKLLFGQLAPSVKKTDNTIARLGNAEDEDMSVVGAEADDAEAEFIRSVCEKAGI